MLGTLSHFALGPFAMDIGPQRPISLLPLIWDDGGVKRAIAELLVAALVLLSPGPQTSQALAKSFQRGGAPAGAPGSLGAAPSAPVGELALPVSPPALAPDALPEAAPAALIPAPVALPTEAAVRPDALALPAREAALDVPEAALPEAVRPEEQADPSRRAASESLRAVAEGAAPLAETAAAPTASDGALRDAGAGLSALLTKETPAARSGTPVPVRGGWGRLKGAVAAGLLTLAMIFPSAAPAQNPLPVAPPPAPKGVVGAPEQLPVAPRVVRQPLEARAAVEQGSRTVGQKTRMTLTLRNVSDKEVVVDKLRAALDKAMPEHLEIQGEAGREQIRLAPGETRTIVFEVIAWDAPPAMLGDQMIVGGIGELRFPGARVPLAAAEGEAAELVVPEAVFRVQSVLTPEWITPEGQPNFKDIYGVQRGKDAYVGWIAAGALALILLVALERILAARAKYNRLSQKRRTLAEKTLARLSAMKIDGDPKAFYAELWDILHTFLVDYYGLPVRERDSASLLKDLDEAGVLTSEQADVARLLAQATNARFAAGSTPPAAEHVEAMRQLVTSVAGAPPAAGPAPAKAAEGTGKGEKTAAMGAALFGAFSLGGLLDGMAFENPAALLLLIPLGLFALWRVGRWLFSRGRRTPGAVALSADHKGRVPWRARLLWLSPFLIGAALSLGVVSVANPQKGTTRTEMKQPAIRAFATVDTSGSMGSMMTDAKGGQMTALQAAVNALREYTIIQRRGTSNQIGIGDFATSNGDHTYVYVRVSPDYDAVFAALNELYTKGSTPVGEAILSGMVHFFEVNAYELRRDPNYMDDPRVAELHGLLDREPDKGGGFQKALQFVRRAGNEDLLEKVLRPDHNKVIILFTDGESNSGIDPVRAAEIAKGVGIRVYTVGINTSGSSEATLKRIAEITGAKYYHVSDPSAMTRAVLDIDRLEKKMEYSDTTFAIKSYQQELAAAAFVLLALQIMLFSTALRRLNGFIPLLFLLPLGAMPEAPRAAPAAQVQAAGAMVPVNADAPRGIAETLPTTRTPPLIIEANRKYAEGKYIDAIKLYTDALAEHPEIVETYLNLGNAYYRLGDGERAMRNWQEYVRRTSDPAAQSRAIYNMGNLALMQRDAKKAMEFYKQALRVHDGNEWAKWNIEVLNRLRQQQQQQQGGGQGQPQPGQGQPGQGQPGQGQPGQGQPGQGQPGQGQGGQGDQQQPGDGQQQPGQGNPTPGQGGAAPRPGGEELRRGLDGLEQGQGEAERDAQGRQRQGIPRKGSGVWGFAPLALFGAGGLGSLGWPEFLTKLGIAGTNPLFFWAALAAVPLLGLFLFWRMRRNLRAARALDGNAPGVWKNWAGRWRWAVKTGAALIAAAGLALGAAGPQAGKTQRLVSFGGKDIIVASDVSVSAQYAEDQRMEQEKAALVDFAAELEGTDRIGLVVFAKQGRTASPLSIYYDNFIFKMRRLEREGRGLEQGSSVVAAIDAAVRAFDNAKRIGDRPRVLILVSDGDIFNENVAEAIELAKKKNIRIYTIGVGGTEGVKMRVPTADGRGFEYVLDEEKSKQAGYDVHAVTRLNEDPLKQIAAATGGRYFPARESSMRDVMSNIATLESATRSETVLAPRSIAHWFLLPGVAGLLAFLLIPDPSSFTPRRRQEPPAPGPKKKANAWAALAAFAIPLSAWPQILPFAVAGAVIALLILVDVWTGRVVSRWITGSVMELLRGWSFQRRFTREAPGLFDFPRERESEKAELARFLAEWNGADKARRGAMLAEASSDPQLWAHKLLTAFLAERGAAAEAAFGAFMSAPGRSLTQVDPIVRGLLARGVRLPSLNGRRARAKLARLVAELDPSAEGSRALLFELAAGSDRALRAAAAAVLAQARQPVPPRRRGTWGRLMLAGAALLLLSTSSLSWFAHKETQRFQELQRVESRAALMDRFSKHGYIFEKHLYTDPLIADEIVGQTLPRWNKTTRADYERFERAVEILRDSADPRADNVLEALLDNADFLPLTAAAEDRLLTALIERDNPEIWLFMERYMGERANDPQASRRLQRMILIGASQDKEVIFQRLFLFLKSQDPAVSATAANAITGSLDDPARGDFMARLNAAAQLYARDAEMQIWAGSFALNRMARRDLPAIDQNQVRQLLNNMTTAALNADAQRPARLAALPPGRSLQPPLTARAHTMMAQALAAAKNANGGVVPAPMAAVVAPQFHATIHALVDRAEALFPGLDARLRELGVRRVSLDLRAPSEEGPRYGYYTPAPVLSPRRETYLQRHAADLFGALSQRPEAGPDARPNLEQFEFLPRVRDVVRAATASAALAGIPAGSSPGERAAEQANDVLLFGHQIFAGSEFFHALQKAGLTGPQPSILEALPQTYTREDLDKRRAFLEDMLAKGNGWGHSYNPRAGTSYAPRPLTDPERRYLALGIEELERIAAAQYPDAAAPAPLRATLGSLQSALAAGDAEAVRAAEAKARQAFEASKVKDAFLLRLQIAQEGRSFGQDAAFQAWLLRFTTDLLASPEGGTLSAASTQPILDAAAAAIPPADALAALAAAVDGAKAAGAQPHAAVDAALRGLLDRRARAAVPSARALAEAASPELKAALDARLLEAGVLRSESRVRDSFAMFHLSELKAGAEAVMAADKLPADRKAELADLIAELDRMLAAGKSLGLAQGGGPEGRSADALNDMIGSADWTGSLQIRPALAAARLELGPSYDRAGLLALRAHFEGRLTKSEGRNFDGSPRPLLDHEERTLAGLVALADQLLGRHFPHADNPKSLVALAPALTGTDAPARLAAEKEAAALLAEGPGGVAAARVDGAAAVLAADPAAQLKLLELLTARMTDPKASPMPEAGARRVVETIAERLRAAGRGTQAWEALLPAAQSGSPAMKAWVLTMAQDQIGRTLNHAQVFPDIQKEYVKEGLRLSEWQNRGRYNQKQAAALEALLARRIAAAEAAGPLTPAQADVRREAAELPALKRAAAAAGMLPGDSAGERAAETINPPLWQVYIVWPGQQVLDDLVRAGLAPDLGRAGGLSPDTHLDGSYTREETQRLLDHLKALLAKDQVVPVNGVGVRPMQPNERRALEEAIRAVERALPDLPETPAAKTGAKGFAPLALFGGLFAAGAPIQEALGEVGWLAWLTTGWGMLFLAMTAAALLAAWLALRRRIAPSDGQSARRQKVSDAVFRQRYAKLELSADKAANAMAGGAFLSRRAGDGTQFDGFKDYEPGDEMRHVDFLASAGSPDGELLVRRYQEEKDMPLILLIDLSGSGEVGSRGVAKRDAKEDAAAMLALLAGRLNIRVGAAIVTDRVEAFIPPKRGLKSARALAQRILAFEPESRRTDLRIPLEFALRRLATTSIVMMISDFVAPEGSPDFTNLIGQVQGRHTFRPVRVSDHRDLNGLPPVPGLVLVADAETGEERWVSPASAAFQEEQRARIARREAQLAQALRGTRPIHLSAEGDYLLELARALQNKGRRRDRR